MVFNQQLNFKFDVGETVYIKHLNTNGVVSEQKASIVNKATGSVVDYTYSVIQEGSGYSTHFNENKLFHPHELSSKAQIRLYDTLIDVSLGNGTTTLDKEAVILYTELKNKAIEAYKNEKKVKTKWKLKLKISYT